MTQSELALQRIHNLYILQEKFLTSFDKDFRSPTRRKVVLADVRTFEELLKAADWRYMGGEDVLASLKDLHIELRTKIKNLSPRGKKAKGKR